MTSRQGVDDRFVERQSDRASRHRAGDPLRIGFLGRLDPVKGVDILVDAVAALPATTDVELVIRGLPQDDALRTAHQRARCTRPASHGGGSGDSWRLATELARFDVLAIPSRWLETGPLVALEARAAGRPVAASRRGGLAEILREPEDGWLLPPDDRAHGQRLFARLADDPSLARRCMAPTGSPDASCVRRDGRPLRITCRADR